MKNDDIFNPPLDQHRQHGSLAGKYKRDWVEENFEYFATNGKIIHIPTTRNFLGATISGRKLKIFLLIVACAVAVIFGRVFYLQIIKGDYYRGLAENNRIRLKPTPAERGLIYDRNGESLVQNVPSFLLSIVPQDLPKNAEERKAIIAQIALVSGVPAKDITELIKKYSDYSYESLVVKDNLDYQSALELYVQNANLPGILIEKGTQRLYRLTGFKQTGPVASLSHVIGYLGKINETELANRRSSGYLASDHLGKTGLEKFYETELRGIYGKKKIEVDALGREQNVLAEEAPQPGKNLILSLDLEGQEKMETLIKRTLAVTKTKKAAAIAMNPQTGEILALVSWPSFDNNNFSSGISQENYQKYVNDPDQPLFNRVIAGTYPSGSTVKPLYVAAALQEGIVTKNTSFLSTGGLRVDQWFFPDWKAGGHGVTNAAKALAWSVNTYFYYIGGGYGNFVGLGVEKMVNYLKKFGLAAPTGIDLPGEESGFLPSKKWKEETKKEMWYVGDTYNLSIGQGDLLVTPLQVAVWTSTVANGGSVVKPHLVKAITDPITKKSTPIKTEYLNENVVSAANMDVAQQGMRECVIYGSCQLLKSLPFTSGGKTGTAQWSTTKPEHAWFTAFAPFNQPEIVVTVLIEGGGEGSIVAMPIARDWLAWWGQKYLK
ncbi:MAG: penicillin-binding protein 2 [Patescibacteria group bacterium]|nr:penicillin-binding protein 2 [Patescibacteria group bacterium]